MEFNKLKIVPLGDMRYRVYLDGNEIQCTKLKLEMGAQEMTTVELTMPCELEDMEEIKVKTPLEKPTMELENLSYKSNVDVASAEDVAKTIETLNRLEAEDSE